VAYRGGSLGVSKPPRNSEVLTKLSHIPSSVENTSVTTLSEYRFRSFANWVKPWLGGYRPQIPGLSALCPQLNLLNPPPETKSWRKPPPPPKKIPGYVTGDDVGFVSGLLFEFPAGRNMMCLLIVAQQSWHKFHRTVSHVQIVHQNALNGPIWQSYYLTNIVDSLPMICKDSLTNICYVFRCCACRLSSRTLIVVDRRLSILEAFVL
jgi:hypothetical protein